MLRLSLVIACILVLNARSPAADPPDWSPLLSQSLLDRDCTFHEVQNYCERRVPRMPEVASAADWDRIASDLRTRVLRDVVLRGEAAAWAAIETEPEWQEVLDAPDYRIRKLRFQAVPGLWVPALLYEPKQLSGQVPVVMNVNGHDGNGKAADYKQTRCINQAKRGMLTLNIEWVGMGQLRSDDFVHYRMNQLDLCGTSGLAPFYLSMKRGLDILLQHEHADPRRVAVAGLSGGGWQTIFISGLDERVTLANPVAGYSSFRTRARVQADLGDSEQTPSDLATVVDYTHLTAMRAPRPTLLTNNDRDQCCFTAGNALPLLLQATRPIYQLYEESDNLWVHINHIPGSHNFEQDNREALYRALGAHFYPDSDFNTAEIPCNGELRTAEELSVVLPADNAGFNTLAKRLAADLPETSPPATEDSKQTLRRKLSEIIRSRDLRLVQSYASVLHQTPQRTVRSYRFSIGDEWTVPAVEIAPANATRRVIVVCDGGRTAAINQIARLIADGATVTVVDLFYFGECKIPKRDYLYGLLIAAVGERPLGLQVDQLRAIVQHDSAVNESAPIELYAVGRRLGLAASIVAAMEPDRVSTLTVEGGLTSLRQVIDENIAVNEAPELFCFGLLKTCDIPQIEALIAPRTINKIARPAAPQSK
ncbi:MAG: alpha/beta hydrolase family protein [Planctomycetaceae bacterium]